MPSDHMLVFFASSGERHSPWRMGSYFCTISGCLGSIYRYIAARRHARRSRQKWRRSWTQNVFTDKVNFELCQIISIVIYHSYIRFPRVKLSASLKDSHVYVCRRYVLDLLHEKPHFISLKEEFFPWLCKIQYRRSKRVKYGKSRWSDHDHIHNRWLMSPSALRNMVEPTSQSISLQHSSFSDKSSQAHKDDSPIDPDDDIVQTKIGVVVHDKESEPAMRINSLHTFFEANKRVWWPSIILGLSNSHLYHRCCPGRRIACL